MNFYNIYNFFEINDYLPILNGVIITDLFIILLLIFGFIKSKMLVKWYKIYGLNAVIADVLIIVIGFIIARYIYSLYFNKFNIINFIFVLLLVQIIHDILFYIFFSLIKRGKSQILDFFKDYANETSYKAILSDSFMMLLSAILASYFKGLTLNSNIIILIISIYLIPYFLGSL